MFLAIIYTTEVHKIKFLFLERTPAMKSCRHLSAYTNTWRTLVAQTVKCLPAMRETWVRFLGREDPLEKEMAIHFSTLAWKIPWTEEPDRLQSMGLQRVGHDWVTSLHFTQHTWASLMAPMVKRLPAMLETWVQFLGREDPLEKEMAIHSSTRAWKIPWTEEPDKIQSMGSQSQTRLSDFTSLHFSSYLRI